MKRNFIVIGVFGALALVGWIAVASGQRRSDSDLPPNPLRNEAPADDANADRATERPNPLLAPDTIPDASSLPLPTAPIAAADASDSREPAPLASPLARQPAPRNVPKTGNAAVNDDDQYYNNRRPAPRAASENDEPARINDDVFDGPALAPVANGQPRESNLPDRRTSNNAVGNYADENGYESTVPNNAANRNSFNHNNRMNNAVGPNSVEPMRGGNQGGEGVGQPGAKQLEGLQCPQVSIQKLAPPEVQVGRTATFKTVVRNTGTIPAGQVEVRDSIPRGTRLLSTTPKATQGARGEIIWTLGTLRPGEESAVEMELMPIAEGEIGSVATIHFGADASAKTICTRPDIAVQTTAPAQALIGEKVLLSIAVSNPGSGIATNVVIEEHIPAGLQLPPELKHLGSNELEYKIGTLKPGESKKLDLEMIATTAGPITNLLSVRADGNLRQEDRLQLEVVAPKLNIAMDGPKKRYLEREATYQLSVSNPGTAAAQSVELAAYLPQGMKFVSANNQGHYDEATRAVYWRLDQLPTRETGTVELVALPVEAGQHSIKLRGSAQRVQPIEKEQPVMVEGIAAVMFQVGDSVDPIEIGGETTYEIRVVNQGTKPAGNVQLTAVLPAELKALSADGPTRYAIQGNAVVFEGLTRLAPKSETTYHVRVKGLRPGDLRAQFKLITDDMQRPVTKEESTQVYADE
jgi:uncharacterized repeat protein (TIGR01451 family)